jgi:DNA polymerase-3 subunit delta'
MLFKDIIGQAEAKERLVREVRDGRIAHAQLFSGETGVGTLPLALAYARYIQCRQPAEHDACGTCPSCVKWNKLVHPDVHFVFPIVKKGKPEAVCDDYIALWRNLLLTTPYFGYAQWLDTLDAGTAQPYIYAKESDEITRKLNLKSSEGGYKICIIWLPEKMYKDNVFGNKLLKLLEEPPEKTLFLLVSETPDSLLPTILSRTQLIRMRKLHEDEIAEALQQRYGVQPADSLTLAHLANGNFVKALEAIHLNEDNEHYFELFVSLMRLSYQRKIREMKQWSEQVAGMGREKQKNFLEYAQRMVRENFVHNFHRPQMNYLTVPEENFATRFAPFINERNVAGLTYELSEAQAHIEQNVNAKMVFFDFALKTIVLLKNP